MKKYETPVLEQDEIELEDIIATSKVFGDPSGDNVDFPW